VKCPRCGSLERHRFLSLLLGVLAPELRDLDTVVEIGPSRQSTVLIDQLGARRRIGLDFGYDGREVDALACLTRLPLRDGSVDLLVCYHVLEHVPDDAAAMHEIARVLSPRGIALLQVPIRMGVPTEEDPAARIELSEATRGVLDALASLPEAQRQVITLRWVGGLSLAEVAEILGCKVGAVKALQHRGVEGLRSRLVAVSQPLDLTFTST